jgi:hypothetical protein
VDDVRVTSRSIAVRRLEGGLELGLGPMQRAREIASASLLSSASREAALR